jgi:hypothetical protein
MPLRRQNGTLLPGSPCLRCLERWPEAVEEASPRHPPSSPVRIRSPMTRKAPIRPLPMIRRTPIRTGPAPVQLRRPRRRERCGSGPQSTRATPRRHRCTVVSRLRRSLATDPRRLQSARGYERFDLPRGFWTNGLLTPSRPSLTSMYLATLGSGPQWKEKMRRAR